MDTARAIHFLNQGTFFVNFKKEQGNAPPFPQVAPLDRLLNASLG